MDNYDDPNAPWNKENPPEKEIEVLVSMTLSKTVKIKVNDYTEETGIDEEGDYFDKIDYSSCNLYEAVKNQVYLLDEAYKFIDTKNKKDFEGWNIDELEIIKE